MLHACRIKDGKVSYCNRYVSTARLERERSLGFPIYMRVRPCAVVTGVCHCCVCLQTYQSSCVHLSLLVQIEDMRGRASAAHALLFYLQTLICLTALWATCAPRGVATHAPLSQVYSKPDLPDRSLLMQFGDMRGLGGAAHALLQQAKLALGVIAKKPGSGTANTALVYHARKLLALHEGDLPYAVRLAELVGQGF